MGRVSGLVILQITRWVACWWAAVLEKITRAFGQEPYAQKAQSAEKVKKRTSQLTNQPTHCGLNGALGGSSGIDIASFPLHFSIWYIQSEKHLSAYFQMLWNYLYPILTHFYWIKSFKSLECKRRQIWENQVKITARLSYISYLNCLMFWPIQFNFCLCSMRFLNKVLKKIIFLLI